MMLFKTKPEPEYMRVRRLAARLWAEDGGRGLLRAGAVHGFMVSSPEAQRKYEAKARQLLGVA